MRIQASGQSLAQREQPTQTAASIWGFWVRQDPVLLAKAVPGGVAGDKALLFFLSILISFFNGRLIFINYVFTLAMKFFRNRTEKRFEGYKASDLSKGP